MNHIALSLLLFVTDLMVAPQLYHLDRFPFITRDQWSKINEFNCLQQVHLWNIANLYPVRHDLKEIACDLEKRRKAWDALDNARNSVYFWYRRAELARLLSLIGEEAFMMGRMPEPY